MKTALPILCATFLILTGSFAIRADDEADSTLTTVGQEAPAFECTTLEGKKISLSELRGKVVVVNFFATWCGPCLAEMPHLEKEVWQKFKSEKFVLVAIGREHENKELVAFQKKQGVTFPLAGDPKRVVFAKYARQSIPRNYVIGADGKIAYQSIGYGEGGLDKLVEVVKQELEKAK